VTGSAQRPIATLEEMRAFIAPFRVEPGRKVNLHKDFDPRQIPDGVTKDDADALLKRGVELLAEYQTRLAAQDTFGLLVVFQAIDAAGKDGTIKHVMSGINPQGVEVSSFKAPTTDELDHDYLWRTQKRVPGRGTIGIFNRSHYEEVLVVRVHPEFLAGQRLPPEATGKDVWTRRYREINDWERYLSDNGIRVVKLFLNVSKGEQKKRFLARIDDLEANWKFSAADVRERHHWDDYQRAYGDVLSHTSTEHAPWYVIPADRKWFMRVAAAAVILDQLVRIDPQFPVIDEAARAEMLKARQELLAEPD
jgi:PPK2 family polyphosphate:nucleotide phosphotransferase